MKKENPDCVNFKQGLVNFYNTQRYGYDNLFPGFESYAKTCENMAQRAKDLAEKSEDLKDEFKLKAPVEMNIILKEVAQIIE